MKQKTKKHNNRSPSIRKVTQIEKRKPGRMLIYDERMKARTINMTDKMYDRLGNEATARNMSGGQSEMQRKINEWFFDALDRQRGDAEDNQMFDEVLAEENKKQ